jgi:hypothetical protein
MRDYSNSESCRNAEKNFSCFVYSGSDVRVSEGQLNCYQCVCLCVCVCVCVCVVLKTPIKVVQCSIVSLFMPLASYKRELHWPIIHTRDK